MKIIATSEARKAFASLTDDAAREPERASQGPVGARRSRKNTFSYRQINDLKAFLLRQTPHASRKQETGSRSLRRSGRFLLGGLLDGARMPFGKALFRDGLLFRSHALPFGLGFLLRGGLLFGRHGSHLFFDGFLLLGRGGMNGPSEAESGDEGSKRCKQSLVQDGAPAGLKEEPTPFCVCYCLNALERTCVDAARVTKSKRNVSRRCFSRPAFATPLAVEQPNEPLRHYHGLAVVVGAAVGNALEDTQVQRLPPARCAADAQEDTNADRLHGVEGDDVDAVALRKAGVRSCLSFNGISATPSPAENTLTRFLEAALAEVAKHASEEQDALAALLMDEINSEHRWTESLPKSQMLLDSLAAEALAEFRAGKTKPLDESLSSRQ